MSACIFVLADRFLHSANPGHGAIFSSGSVEFILNKKNDAWVSLWRITPKIINCCVSLTTHHDADQIFRIVHPNSYHKWKWNWNDDSKIWHQISSKAILLHFCAETHKKIIIYLYIYLYRYRRSLGWFMLLTQPPSGHSQHNACVCVCVCGGTNLEKLFFC